MLLRLRAALERFVEAVTIGGSDHSLNETRTRGSHGRGESVRKTIDVFRTGGFYTHSLSELHPVDAGPIQIE